MGTDDSEITPPLGTPKPVPFVGILPSTPPPKPHFTPGARISTPPPVPEKAKQASIIPPSPIYQNEKARPALMGDVSKANDSVLLKLEHQTKLFRPIPLKWFVAAALILSAISFGFGVRSCSVSRELKESQKKIELLEKKLDALEIKNSSPKPKADAKTSFVPRGLRNPPQKPTQKLISKRPIRMRV